jgi:hypothetical protein
MTRALSVVLLTVYCAGLGFGVLLVLGGSRYWWLGLVCVAGGVLVIFEEARILLADREQSSKARGFEVNTTPGTTPGHFEKKEDNHG